MPPISRARATLICVQAYALALVAAVGAALALGDAPPLAVAAVAYGVATVVVFAFSVRYDNSSLYDPYWSVAPPLLATYFAATGDPAVARAALVLGLVFAWGARLTWNWYRGWTGMEHEDWRYRELREAHGRAYWLVSFAGIHGFPTVLTFLGSLALWPALTSPAPLGGADLLAAALTAGAIATEAIADQQLRAFTRSERRAEDILDTGLWALSRHPNYLGEVGFWWGLWLLGVAADPSAWWWTLAGPIAITGLFVGISIPMMEKRMLTKRPRYADHQRRVAMLVPFLRLPRR